MCPAAAGIMGAASIGSSLIGANASEQAASQQVAAQQQVLAMLQQTIGPLISQGQGITASSLPILQRLLTPGANMNATLQALPGFQFAQQQGQQAITNQGTTMGLGGNTLASAGQFATGLANQYYGNYVGQLQNLTNAGLGLESSAAGALAGGSQSALTGIGNAQATGTLGAANAYSSGLSGLGNAGLLYALGNRGALGSSAAGGNIYGNQVAGLANTAIPVEG